jgi:hypothetical protein
MRTLAALLFTSCIVYIVCTASASALLEDKVEAATHSRALKEDLTPEEIEKARADDREVWNNADHGGKKLRRALKATFGTAIGRAKNVSTPTSSSLKVQPNGYDCLIASSTTGIADCSRNLAYVVPACCNSSSEISSTKCQSWDNAQNTVCSASATPYPACCTFRNQPYSACNVYPNSVVQCGTAKPGVGCCRSASGICAMNDNGSGGTCTGASVGCCPA